MGNASHSLTDIRPSTSLPRSGEENLAGVYGLALSGLDGAASLLSPARPVWPRLQVRQWVGVPSPVIDDHLDDRSEVFTMRGQVADLRLTHAPDGDGLVLDAWTPDRWTDETVVHPLLAMGATVANWWHGRQVFHAGAFVTPEGAWAVAGAKTFGKSTLLAWLARRGVPVLADDVLVVDGADVLVGPRCVDLRADAGERLGGEDLGVVGTRPRWRLRLDAAPERAPLLGWVLPDWDTDVTLTRLRPSERMGALLPHLGVGLPPRSPEQFLALASLPMVRLGRPRDWALLDDVADRLLSL